MFGQWTEDVAIKIHRDLPLLCVCKIKGQTEETKTHLYFFNMNVQDAVWAILPQKLPLDLTENTLHYMGTILARQCS